MPRSAAEPRSFSSNVSTAPPVRAAASRTQQSGIRRPVLARSDASCMAASAGMSSTVRSIALNAACTRCSAGVTTSELAHVGVGSPGEIGSASGTVTSARNLPGWEGSYPLAAVLEDDLGAPVSLGNDVQVATDAEAHLGAGRPYRSMLGVFWGTGVGGGI